jgi:hypothetical protein
MKMPTILVATGEMIGIDGEVSTTITVFLELSDIDQPSLKLEISQ